MPVPLKKIVLLTCALFQLFAHGCQKNEQFPVVYDLTQIEQEALSSGPGALCVFDIDDVLLVEEEAQRGYIEDRKKILDKVFASHASDPIIIQLLFSIMLRDKQLELPDTRIPEMFSNLRRNGVAVVGLTSAGAGRYYAIHSLSDLRNRELFRVGVDLRPPVEISPIYFTTLSKKNSIPIYKDGILFTDGICEKGPLLCAFLKRIGLRPNKVIFVDDTLRHLHSVKEAMTGLNIPCSCYHDRVIDVLPKSFDEKITELQFKHLLEHRQWLNAQQAQKTLCDSLSPANTK
jgi:hypothetical protein